MTDVLARIEETLEAWQRGRDAVRWVPDLLPRLSGRQAEIARLVAARTGCDGYAAVFMVADVAVYGVASPFAEDVTGAALQVPAEWEPGTWTLEPGALTLANSFEGGTAGLAITTSAPPGRPAVSGDEVWESLARFQRVTWRSCWVMVAVMVAGGALSLALAAWHAPMVSLVVPVLMITGGMAGHRVVVRRETRRYLKVCAAALSG